MRRISSDIHSEIITLLFWFIMQVISRLIYTTKHYKITPCKFMLHMRTCEIDYGICHYVKEHVTVLEKTSEFEQSVEGEASDVRLGPLPSLFLHILLKLHPPSADNRTELSCVFKHEVHRQSLSIIQWSI